MYYRIAVVCILAAVSPFSDLAAAEQPAFSVKIVATFDYPGVGNSTTGVEINDDGTVAGFFTNSSGMTSGFVRLRDGTFSAPIVEPDDGNTTLAFGINNIGTVSGYFVGAGDGFFHGYLLAGGNFTPFDVPGALSTMVGKNNDAGDFVGAFTTSTHDFQAYVNVGGNTDPINIPPALTSFAEGMNQTGDVVGFYADSGGIVHAFFRSASGVLKFPINFPGAVLTSVLEDVNDQGEMVGRYTDGAGVIHGAFFKRPGVFASFDFPGASATSLNGINNAGFVTGRYTDDAGVRHGFILRIAGASAP